LIVFKRDFLVQQITSASAHLGTSCYVSARVPLYLALGSSGSVDADVFVSGCMA